MKERIIIGMNLEDPRISLENLAVFRERIHLIQEQLDVQRNFITSTQWSLLEQQAISESNTPI